MTQHATHQGSSTICEFYVGEELHKGAAYDLSTSGFFVATDAEVASGEELHVRLIGSGAREPVYLKAIVAGSIARGGLGPTQARGLELRVIRLSPEYGALLGAATRRVVERGPLLSERNREAAGEYEWVAGIAGEDPSPPSVNLGAEADRSLWDEEDRLFDRAGEPLWAEDPVIPAALVIDDGELDDVVAMIEGLGADTRRVRLGTATTYPNWSPPERLLVVTAERALSLRLPVAAYDDAFTAVVVTTSGSRTIPMMMHRLGYRYVVRRPAHPEALRSLMRRALNDDKKRRHVDRATMGCPIRWRRRFLSRSGTLIDLSVDGCQLLVHRPTQLGTRLKVRIPRVVSGRRRLVIKGQVVRRMNLEGGQRVLGVRFDKVSVTLRDRIEQAIKALSDGPFRLSGELPRDDPAWQGENDGTPESGPFDHEKNDRRRKPRVDMTHPLVSLDLRTDEVRHALMARDLSVDGMRIEPDPALALKDQMRLAFFHSESPEPLILHAVVARDDGPNGFWLRFVGVADEARVHLCRALETRPWLESVEDAEPEPAWAMVGQVPLEREPGPRE